VPPDRGHRPRLPRGLGLEGLPAYRAPSAGSRCRRASRRASVCPSRYSRPRRRPRSATTRTSTCRGGAARRRGLASAVRDVALALYASAPVARAAGIILADTKFEFGVDRDGRAAADRRGPDARLVALLGRRDYEPGRPQASFDKQFVRDWLERSLGQDRAGPELPADVVAGTRARYVEAFERITGASFDRYLEEDVIAR
jgi:hypothetical protein